MKKAGKIGLKKEMSAVGMAGAWLFLLCLQGTAGDVTLPYSNDFTVAVDELTVDKPAYWLFTPEMGVYTNNLTYTNRTGYAVFSAPVLGGTDIAQAKPFTFTTVSGWINNNTKRASTYVGVSALGTDTAAGYLVCVYEKETTSDNRRVALFRSGVVKAYSTTPVGLNGLLIQVKGVYTDTNADGVQDALTLTASCTNVLQGGASVTLSTVDAAPLTGDAFSLRGSVSSSDASYVAVSWDSVSLTDDTPPPSGTVVFVF